MPRSSNYRFTRRKRKAPVPTMATVAIEAVYNMMYKKPFDKWVKQLKSLARLNARNHGAQNVNNYGISVEGKSYYTNITNIEDLQCEDFPQPCLEIHEDFPIPELERVIWELENIQKELYEVKAFLAGLATYGVPDDLYEDILGTAFYHHIKNKLKNTRYMENVSRSMYWDYHAQRKFQLYLAEQADVVNTIKQRVLINVITV